MWRHTPAHASKAQEGAVLGDGGPHGLQSSCKCLRQQQSSAPEPYICKHAYTKTPNPSCASSKTARGQLLYQMLSDSYRQSVSNCNWQGTGALMGASCPIKRCCEQARGSSICTPIVWSCNNPPVQHQKNHKRCSQLAAIRSQHGQCHEPCTCHEHCHEHIVTNMTDASPQVTARQRQPVVTRRQTTGNTA
jgi:hypothetical protein